MKYPTLFSILFASAISLTVKAQTTDSLHYGLGRTVIRKDATQAITIKGADLEKMPYNTLTDALRAWLYGMYGTSVTYIANVNGMVMVNADMLSIYDIDEITLVQNAATTVNGAAPSQVMLLITTKKGGAGKSGINVAGQTNRVTAHSTDQEAVDGQKGYYHQYYLSGYMNSNNISAGISADFQRYVPLPVPAVNALAGYKETFDTYRINGYLQAKMGQSTLNVNAGYVPQRINYSGFYVNNTTSDNDYSNNNTNIWYGTASLATNIGDKLHNVFNVGVEHGNVNGNYNSLSVYPNSVQAAAYQSHNTQGFAAYVFNDNLRGTFSSGLWNFEPSLNIAYRYATQNEAVYYLASNQAGSTTGSTEYGGRLRGALLTPSFNVGYNGVVNLQAGFEAMLTDAAPAAFGYKQPKLYPFATASVNLSKAAGIDSSSLGWRLYGSFARSNVYMQDAYFLLFTVPVYTTPIRVYPNAADLSATAAYNPYAVLSQWQAGTSVGVLNNRLVFSYAYSLRKYVAQSAYTNPSIVSFGVTDVNLHRLGIDFSWLQGSKLSWRSSLNGTFMLVNGNQYGIITAAYDRLNERVHEFTGGFANRLALGHITGGLDLIYASHQQVPPDAVNPLRYANYFSISNMYVGYQFSAGKLKHLEVFANGRNLINSKQYYDIDALSYYGLGFRAGF